MATQAWPALGTTLGVIISGDTYSNVGEILSISNAGGGEVGERDTTNLASTVHTNAPTIPDNGEVSFELNLDPTDTVHQQIRTWKDSPPSTIPTWQVTYACTGTHTSTFAAWVKTFDGANAEGVDDNLTASITLRVTGAVTNS